MTDTALDPVIEVSIRAGEGAERLRIINMLTKMLARLNPGLASDLGKYDGITDAIEAIRKLEDK